MRTLIYYLLCIMGGAILALLFHPTNHPFKFIFLIIITITAAAVLTRKLQ